MQGMNVLSVYCRWMMKNSFSFSALLLFDSSSPSPPSFNWLVALYTDYSGVFVWLNGSKLLCLALYIYLSWRLSALLLLF